MDYNYAETGLTPMDIEEKGESFDSVRAATIAAIGDRTIVGHCVPLSFMLLDYLPRHYAQNAIIDIAYDNRVNFEVMVRNNQRHSGMLGLNAIAFILVNKNVQTVKHDTLDDTQTMIEVFHYMYHKMFEHNEVTRHQQNMLKQTSDILASDGVLAGGRSRLKKLKAT